MILIENRSCVSTINWFYSVKFIDRYSFKSDRIRDRNIIEINFIFINVDKWSPFANYPPRNKSIVRKVNNTLLRKILSRDHEFLHKYIFYRIEFFFFFFVCVFVQLILCAFLIELTWWMNQLSTLGTCAKVNLE